MHLPSTVMHPTGNSMVQGKVVTSQNYAERCMQAAQCSRPAAAGVLDGEAAAAACGRLVLPSSLMQPAPQSPLHHSCVKVSDHALVYPHRYLDKVDAAVKAARQATEGPITLLAHSAGGWMARVYLLVRPDALKPCPFLPGTCTAEHARHAADMGAPALAAGVWHGGHRPARYAGQPPPGAAKGVCFACCLPVLCACKQERPQLRLHTLVCAHAHKALGVWLSKR